MDDDEQPQGEIDPETGESVRQFLERIKRTKPYYKDMSPADQRRFDKVMSGWLRWLEVKANGEHGRA
jgi:hypothetical protein